MVIECRRLITLRKRCIIEVGDDDVCDVTLQFDLRLTNMEQLRSVLAKNVHSQKFKSLAVKKKFQAAIGVAGDLAACNFAIIGYANFIRNVGVRELFLRFTNEG